MVVALAGKIKGAALSRTGLMCEFQRNGNAVKLAGGPVSSVVYLHALTICLVEDVNILFFIVATVISSRLAVLHDFM